MSSHSRAMNETAIRRSAVIAARSPSPSGLGEVLDGALDEPGGRDGGVGRHRQAGEQEDGQRDREQDEVRVAGERGDAAALGPARGF